MNEDFWKEFPVIPGFDCAEIKREAQLKVYERIRDMDSQQLVDYFQRGRMERSASAPTEKKPA